MKKTYLLLIFSICFIFCSCKKQKNIIENFSLKNDTTINQLSDTSFIWDVRSMHFDKYLYLTDYKRDQIIVLDNKGNFIRSIGTKGQGPGEFLGASHLFVINDTIFVANDGKRCIEMYKDYKYLRTINLPKNINLSSEYRFFYKNEKIYLTSLSASNSIASFDINTGLIKYLGKSVEFGTAKQTEIRNKRHLFSFKNFLIAVSDNMPIVEKYDLAGNLLESFDYSDIQEVDHVLNYFKKNDEEQNSYYQLVTDAYLNNNNLYILLLTVKNNTVFSNTVLTIDVNTKMHTQEICNIGKGWFSSIGIEDDSMWAFNQEKGLIHLILN